MVKASKCAGYSNTFPVLFFKRETHRYDNQNSAGMMTNAMMYESIGILQKQRVVS